MKYFDELKRAMSFLVEHPKTVFIGQAVEYGGTGLYDSLSHLPLNKRIELPVAEYLQSGLANGMTIEGLIPVSTYPRWNFLLLAANQVVNHLDKMKIMSGGGFTPKVIISHYKVGANSQDIANNYMKLYTEAQWRNV